MPITLEAFLLPFAERFRNHGWRVDALANGASRNEHIASAFDARFDVAWSRNPFAPRNLLGGAAAVRRVVAAGGYDIVHVHTPVAAFVTRYALRRARLGPGGPRVIYTAHGFHFYEGQSALPHAALRSLERIAAPWTDYLVTINAEDDRAARAFGGLDPARVRYIPGIGVDTARFRPDRLSAQTRVALRRELGVPEDAFMLAMVAEMAPLKRHELALDALSRTAEDRVHLVLVGTGPLEGKLRVRARALGLSDRVHFAGYRRDVPDVLAAADAAMLVSEREGLARSVLEAMASGKLVIGTETRGIADAIGDAGIVVSPADAVALGAAIDRAAREPGLAAHLGAAARTRACERFSLDTVLDAYEELYSEAVA